ncbi:MAG: 1-acyl-sn-glycerol-3-phosphate acyltransferase [Sneathiella sp.]|nr:1-acyl-sn-glycerol-3-phosphate acyltransferase [Sneathiella sp.]
MTIIRSFFVVLIALLWTVALIPLQLFILQFLPKKRYLLPQIYHNGICRLLRVRVITHGIPSTDKPTLFVLNHISWLDIPVVGKTMKGSFVARTEVEDYPLFGTFSRLQQTIFIAQTRPSVKTHKDDMQLHLQQGDSIFLFPEGTSSNGIIIQKFKSTYFALAEQYEGDTPLTVQPVTLAYSQMDNLMMTRGTMIAVAWVGNEPLLGHIWNFLKTGSVTAELRFHAPITIKEYESRKKMAIDCQLTITKGLSRALTDRPEL